MHGLCHAILRKAGQSRHLAGPGELLGEPTFRVTFDHGCAGSEEACLECFQVDSWPACAVWFERLSLPFYETAELRPEDDVRGGLACRNDVRRRMF